MKGSSDRRLVGIIYDNAPSIFEFFMNNKNLSGARKHCKSTIPGTPKMGI